MEVGPFRFVQPSFLWLLAGLAPLALLWLWQAARRWMAVRRMRTSRTVPVRERFVTIGDLGFWLFAMIAMASTVAALARPQAIVSVVGIAGADVVVLLDGSASMRVPDVRPNRWQRSIRWVRTLAETLSWRDDRVALGLFAHNAAPQLRLTRDPNALLFFLDHLGREPPFRLDVDTTWDTNIEAGLYWGLRLIDKNEELYGPSANAKAFVVLTDGQAWSGDVARSLEQTARRRIPTYIIGVGTVGGGMVPEPAWPGGFAPAWADGGPIHSELDRPSLQDMAMAGRGRYFELDREPDRTIALRIVQEVRSHSAGDVREELVDVYWRFLLGAAGALGAALLFLRERAQLVWPAAAALTALLLLVNLAP